MKTPTLTRAPGTTRAIALLSMAKTQMLKIPKKPGRTWGFHKRKILLTEWSQRVSTLDFCRVIAIAVVSQHSLSANILNAPSNQVIRKPNQMCTRVITVKGKLLEERSLSHTLGRRALSAHDSTAMARGTLRASFSKASSLTSLLGISRSIKRPAESSRWRHRSRP